MREFFSKSFRIRRRKVEIEPEEIFMDAVNIPGFRAELHEGRMERPIPRSAFFALALLVVVGGLVIAGRLVELGLFRGRTFALQAQANKTYPIIIAPPRGIFYDRYGEKLVENTPSFAVSLETAAFRTDEMFAAVVARLTKLFGTSVAEIAEANGLASASASVLQHRGGWPGEIFIAAGGDLYAPVLEIQARPEEFEGVVISESIRRSYSLGALTSHLLGYISRPSREDLARRPEVRPIDVVGKSGLELWYESELRGRAGEKLIEVNARGEPQRERFIVKAEPGSDVLLEVDAGLQRFAAETLARHLKALGKKAGVVIALDPRDGAIRTLVSYPGYDPNLFNRGVSAKEFERLADDPAHPFFNRAITGGYPTGSTIKPFLAAAALEEEVIAPERAIYDPGFISVPNPYDPAHPTIFKDWKALGWVDMRRAIAMSANVYFYTIGGGYRDIRGLGIERIRSWLERFGWGRALGIDLPGEYAGLLPDPEKKKTIRPKDPVWRIGDTYITAIGQGDLEATPLQLAVATAAIANGGTIWKPRLARAIASTEGGLLREFRPEAVGRVPLSAETLAVVREGMRQAVTEGSAAALNDLFFSVAGKTGTAQTGVYGKNHGWFTGFAPAEAPELVITVLVEEGTGGSTDAVPIAKEVLYYYFTKARNPQLTPLQNSQ